MTGSFFCQLSRLQAPFLTGIQPDGQKKLAMRLLSGENHTDDLARAFEQCLALVELFGDGNSGYVMKLKSIAWWMFCLAGICLGSSDLQAQTCGNGYPCGPDGAPLLQMLTPQGFMGADFRGSCSQHDRCYQVPGISRRYCDLQFRNELHRRCNCSAFPLGCRMIANTMYLQVRLFGRRPYLNSQYPPTYPAPMPYPVYSNASYSQPVVYYGY
ncbi:MAG TPA: hypothetical protein DCM07_30065 [Planctomycetaceae bacterium]|nr:hypothetical protein [Gimesia sp.]HAH49011.1 hypothetical protein [Planctomycetaceae bacterium]|tara:strand:- start:10878 stop:11516 length:639 start_codon:yes stop_codon:yes gene_type:complete